MKGTWGRPNTFVLRGNKLRVGSLELGSDVPVPKSLHLLCPTTGSSWSLPWISTCSEITGWTNRSNSVSAPTSLRSYAIESQPKIFLPLGTYAEFYLQSKSYFFTSMASSASAFFHFLLPLAPALQEYSSLSPQEDHFSPLTFPSLMQSPGPYLWTYDCSWQQDLATSLPLGPQKTLIDLASTQNQVRGDTAYIQWHLEAAEKKGGPQNINIRKA